MAERGTRLSDGLCAEGKASLREDIGVASKVLRGV